MARLKSASFSAAACALFATVLLSFTARGQLENSLYNYAGDAPFLNFWVLTFTNFPIEYWDTQTGSPCNSKGYVGVRCAERYGEQHVVEVDLSFNSRKNDYFPRLEGPLDWNITGVLFLESLDVSGNFLTGPLPPEFALAPSLKSLNVEGNSLQGNLSEVLCSGSMNLSCLHLADNNFTGEIPSCWRKFPCADFAGNNLRIVPNKTCVDSNIKSCPPNVTITYAPPPGPGSSSNLGAILGGVLGGLFFLLVLGVLILLYLRHRENERKKKELEQLAADIETQISTRHFGTLKRFTVAELSASANDFDEDNLLGEGGFSKVYKGTLADGKVVAIKKMKEEKADKGGGELQFLNEVELISRAVHRNLMRCEGFCVEQGTCMLVLPFCRNGSVASRTQGKEGDPLTWLSRQKIAKGAAEGIAYLHTDCNPKLIHRDIKADNVLLDDDDEAIIADFGLAKEMDVKESHATTAVKGTVGHIAPEYFVSGQCSEKTDVYAFGVFLLELASGRDVFDLTVQPEAEEMLLKDWVANLVAEKKIAEFVDKEMKLSEGELEEVEKMLQVALLCMKNEPQERPNMDEVAKLLSGKGLAQKWEQWQVEAGNMRAEDLMQVVNTPAIWENTTTGISLDAFNLSGPR